MSDFTEIESQMNGLKSRNVRSRAELKEAEAAEKKAQAQLDNAEAEVIQAKGKKQRTKIKNTVLTVGLSAVLAAGAMFGYKSRKGVKDFADGAQDLVEAAGSAVKTTGRIAKAGSDFLEEHTKDPDMADFLLKARNQEPNFFRSEEAIRSRQATFWSKVNPEFSLTADELVTLLKQNETFRQENGRFMNNQEAIAAREKLLKDSKKLRNTLTTASRSGILETQRQKSGR